MNGHHTPLDAETSPHPATPTNQPMTPSRSRLKAHLNGDSGYLEDVPEVTLDLNRHIVPEWLFDNRDRGRKARRPSDDEREGVAIPSRRGPESSTVHDYSSPSSFNSHLSHLSPSPHLGPLNSPAIDIPHSIDELHEFHAPTPTPAPSPASHVTALSPRSTALHHTASSPVLPYRMIRDGEVSSGSCTPHQFSGTGSTTVHTGLKERVFSQLLRKLKKKPQHRSRLGEEADDEGNEASLGRAGRKLDYAPEGGNQTIRRTRSDLGPPERPNRDESADRGMFAMEEEVNADDALQMGKSKHGNILSGVHPMSRTAAMSDDISPQTFPPVSIPFKPSTSLQSSPALLPRQPERQARSLSPGHSEHSDPADRARDRGELYIFLENLTGRFKRPCILDLKMGTRQYGIDATVKKKKSQRAKSDQSTSRTMGVRMCGMQVSWGLASSALCRATRVFRWSTRLRSARSSRRSCRGRSSYTQTYDAQTDSFTHRNKYDGRSFSNEEFASGIEEFLSNGHEVLLGHIPIVIQKLHNLAGIISRLRGFRFYGSSVLLVYDGDREAQQSYSLHLNEATHDRPSLHHGTSDTRGGRSRSVDAPRHRQHRPRGEMSVRIVDFARTTTGKDYLAMSPEMVTDFDAESATQKGYDTRYYDGTNLLLARFPPHYPDEPDMGFLFGLRSVVRTLKGIWEDHGGGALGIRENQDVFEKVFGQEMDVGYLST